MSSFQCDRNLIVHILEALAAIDDVKSASTSDIKLAKKIADDTKTHLWAELQKHGKYDKTLDDAAEEKLRNHKKATGLEHQIEELRAAIDAVQTKMSQYWQSKGTEGREKERAGLAEVQSEIADIAILANKRRREREDENDTDQKVKKMVKIMRAED